MKLHLTILVFATLTCQATASKAHSRLRTVKRAAQKEKDTLIFHGPKTNVTVMVDIPELLEVTMCVWLKIDVGDRDSTWQPTPISYAVAGQSNEIFVTHRDVLQFSIKGGRRQTGVVLNDGLWHHLCLSWESDGGEWKVYKDGKLEDDDTSTSSGDTLAGGGTLVLGQDQDQMGGGYQDAQAFIGSLTGFNMWPRALTDAEVEDVYESCANDGDLFAWNISQLLIEGDVTKESSPACDLQAGGRRDPHMHTFSGLRYSYQGYCSYTLTRDCRTSTPFFDVSADFRGLFHPYRPPTRMVAVTTRVDGADTYTFLEDHSVLVNGKVAKRRSMVIGENFGYIQANDKKVELRLEKDDVTLTWIGKDHEASVSIGNNDLAGKLCGMFGDGSRVKGQDLLKSDGTKTVNTTEFADSWVIPGSCP
ncbi:serum amyloid P-component-like [Ptychodera flava]|uniref:serum amyloid P-component-like n=1 Tax=Ptychodera flava TaxID=63121 RepID=UPI00396A4B64